MLFEVLRPFVAVWLALEAGRCICPTPEVRVALGRVGLMGPSCLAPRYSTMGMVDRCTSSCQYINQLHNAARFHGRTTEKNGGLNGRVYATSICFEIYRSEAVVAVW